MSRPIKARLCFQGIIKRFSTTRGGVSTHWSWQLQFRMREFERLLRCSDRSLERRLIDFLDRGGLIVYVLDGDTDVVGLATVSPPFSGISLIEDFVISRDASVFQDDISGCLIQGIRQLAENPSYQEGQPFSIFLGMGTPELCGLRPLFESHGFHVYGPEYPDSLIARIDQSTAA